MLVSFKWGPDLTGIKPSPLTAFPSCLAWCVRPTTPTNNPIKAEKGKSERFTLRSHAGGHQDPRFISRNSLTTSLSLRSRSSSAAVTGWNLQLLGTRPALFLQLAKSAQCYLWLHHQIRLHWEGKRIEGPQKHDNQRQLHARHYAPALRITINCLHGSKKKSSHENWISIRA